MKLLIKLFLLSAIVLIDQTALPAQEQQPASLDELVERGEQAGIPRDRMDQIIARGEDRQIAPEEISGLLELAVDLAEDNLPYDMILQKSMEGLAKRVPGAQIQQVATNLKEGIGRSAEMVDPWLEQESVSSAIEQQFRDRQQGRAQVRENLVRGSAQAIQQNVSEEVISALLDDVSRLAQDRSVSLPALAAGLHVLPDIPTTERDPDLSREIVSRAVTLDFTSQQVQQLPTAMRSAQIFGQLPAEAVGRGVAQQMDRGLTGRQIMENLFRGNVGGGPPDFIPPGLDDIPRPGEGERRGPPDDPPRGPPNGG